MKNDQDPMIPESRSLGPGPGLVPCADPLSVARLGLASFSEPGLFSVPAPKIKGPARKDRRLFRFVRLADQTRNHICSGLIPEPLLLQPQ